MRFQRFWLLSMKCTGLCLFLFPFVLVALYVLLGRGRSLWYIAAEASSLSANGSNISHAMAKGFVLVTLKLDAWLHPGLCKRRNESALGASYFVLLMLRNLCSDVLWLEAEASPVCWSHSSCRTKLICKPQQWAQWKLE